MKKILCWMFVFGMLITSGCGARRLTAEEQGVKDTVASVSDTSKCRFIKMVTQQTMPTNMMDYVQRNTVINGGDSYKMISTNSEMVLGSPIMWASFEVWKCKPDLK